MTGGVVTIFCWCTE